MQCTWGSKGWALNVVYMGFFGWALNVIYRGFSGVGSKM